jgi:hypothetical protein
MLGLGACLAFSGACKKNKPKPTQASEQEGLTNRSFERNSSLTESSVQYKAEFKDVTVAGIINWTFQSKTMNDDEGLVGDFHIAMPNGGNNQSTWGEKVLFTDGAKSLNMFHLSTKSFKQLDFVKKYDGSFMTGQDLILLVTLENLGSPNANVQNELVNNRNKAYAVIKSKIGVFFYDNSLVTPIIKSQIAAYFQANPMPYNEILPLKGSFNNSAIEVLKVKYKDAGFREKTITGSYNTFFYHSSVGDPKYTLYDARNGRLFAIEEPKYFEIDYISGTSLFKTRLQDTERVYGAIELSKENMLGDLYVPKVMLFETFTKISVIQNSQLLALERLYSAQGIVLFNFATPVAHRLIGHDGGLNGGNGIYLTSIAPNPNVGDYAKVFGYSNVASYEYTTYTSKRVVGIRNIANGGKDQAWSNTVKNTAFHVFDEFGNRK